MAGPERLCKRVSWRKVLGNLGRKNLTPESCDCRSRWPARARHVVVCPHRANQVPKLPPETQRWVICAPTPGVGLRIETLWVMAAEYPSPTLPLTQIPPARKTA